MADFGDWEGGTGMSRMGDDERDHVNVRGNRAALLVCEALEGVIENPSMATLSRVLLVSLGLYRAAEGVVAISGASNNTAPPEQPFFSNVAMLNGGSAIYLGNQWVMSAAHVAGSLPASVTFGGVPYSTVSGSFSRLYDPSTYPGPTPVFTDIVLFRLTGDPGLPWLDIATGSPTVGASVMMIGGGRVREASPTFWEVTVVPGPNNDTWTELDPPYTGANAAGFMTTAAREVRWGENQVSAADITIDYGAGPVTMFQTIFNTGAATHEAQGVVGDSGGAVFTPHGDSWRLAGMMVTVGTFDNQPGGTQTAVLGNATYGADLSFYLPQIIDITAIPETGTIGFTTLGAILVSFRRGRTRRAR